MASKTVNHNNSHNDVISIVDHVLESFENMVVKEMPFIAVVYDEEGPSYETSLKKHLTNNDYNDDSSDPMPIIAYNRTVLRECEHGLGRRAKNTVNCLLIPDPNDSEKKVAMTYGATYGEFDIQFLFATKQVELQNKFEIVYNGDEGFSGTKEIEVDMSDLGVFKYFLDWKELSDLQISIEENFYKGIVGMVTVRGFFFTFRSTSGVIQSINQNIIALRDSVENLEDNENLGNILIEP